MLLLILAQMSSLYYGATQNVTGQDHCQLLSVDDILSLIKNKNPTTELIITGRDANPKIIEIADLVTEMKMVKHYYEKGVGARRGIEY